MSSFFKKHINKDKLKTSFDITIKKITRLEEYNGKHVTLSWKRGKRPANAGSLKDVVVQNGEAAWEEKITLQVTLFKEVGLDKFEEKVLLLQLSQGAKAIGRMKIDLGGLAKHDGTTVAEYPFDNNSKKKGQQGSPSLHVQVLAKWLKLNDRLLVRMEDSIGSEQKQGGGSNVEIDGHAYNLKTDDALTETVDTTSGSWEDEEDDVKDGQQENDPFATASVFEAETRKLQDELETAKKQLRLVEGQSLERAKTIELQEKEILSLRSKVVENEELVQRAMGMEGFMDQQMALLREEHEEALRQLAQQHSKQLETEVVRHREELEAALTPPQPSRIPVPQQQQQEEQQRKESTDTLNKERMDEVTQQRDNVQKQVQLLTAELEESAKSLLSFDERLSKKDEKIGRLKDEIKSMCLSLNNITESNQLLKEKTRTMKRRLSQDPPTTTAAAAAASERPFRLPSRPLFANPLLDRHWHLVYLAAFSLVLVLHHLFTQTTHNPDPIV